MQSLTVCNRGYEACRLYGCVFNATRNIKLLSAQHGDGLEVGSSPNRTKSAKEKPPARRGTKVG